MWALPRIVCVVLLSLAPLGAMAADNSSRSSDDAYVAAKSAEIETLRVRASTNPMAGASTTLLEADDLLRRYQRASAAEKSGLRAQLDATLTRIDLELSRPR